MKYIFNMIAGFIFLMKKFVKEFKIQYKKNRTSKLFFYNPKKNENKNRIETYLNGFRSDVNESFNKVKIEKSLKDEEYDDELFNIMTNRIENYQVNTLKYGNNLMIDHYTPTRKDKLIYKIISIRCFFIALKLTYLTVIKEPFIKYKHKKKFQKNMDKNFRGVFKNKTENRFNQFTEVMYNSYLMSKRVEEIYKR